MAKINSVTEYLTNNTVWEVKLLQLRAIMLDLPVKETIKWGIPNYTYNGKNVIGFAAFKHYCSIWFYQGVFLQDKAHKLINAQEGTTKALRQWRFAQEEAIPLELVKAYALEAIENQKLNKRIKPTKTNAIIIPKILAISFNETTGLEKAFKVFSIAKQHEFCKYIQEAKMQTTRIKRLNKAIPLILRGEGLNDQYKK